VDLFGLAFASDGSLGALFVSLGKKGSTLFFKDTFWGGKQKDGNFGWFSFETVYLSQKGPRKVTETH